MVDGGGGRATVRQGRKEQVGVCAAKRVPGAGASVPVGAHHLSLQTVSLPFAPRLWMTSL